MSTAPNNAEQMKRNAAEQAAALGQDPGGDDRDALLAARLREKVTSGLAGERTTHPDAQWFESGEGWLVVSVADARGVMEPVTISSAAIAAAGELSNGARMLQPARPKAASANAAPAEAFPAARLAPRTPLSPTRRDTYLT